MFNNITISIIDKNSCIKFHEVIGLNKIHDDNLYIIGVYEKDTLIGVLSYYDEDEILLFDKIYVIPCFRNKGYGTLLVTQLKKIALKSNINILAKVFNIKVDNTNSALEYLSKCGFETPILKNIYFILDFRKVYDFLIKKKFSNDECIINEKYKILSYKQIKRNRKLFYTIKTNSEEFNSFAYLENKRAGVHESFFIHDDEILGWFVFEINQGLHIQVNSIFSNPKYRYSIMGFRFFKLLFDQCYTIYPDAKTISFNIDPDKKDLLHTYNIIFKDLIISTLNVWYTYYYLNEN